MPPMRSVGSGQQPGDHEIVAFADLISRPLVIAGNGPSANLPPHRRIPADAVIFRMNWFFLESHYHFGSHVDAWFFAIPHQTLEATLAEEIRTKRYTVDRLLSPKRAVYYRSNSPLLTAVGRGRMVSRWPRWSRRVADGMWR